MVPSTVHNQPSGKQRSMHRGRRPRCAHIIFGCRAGMYARMGRYAIPAFPGVPARWRDAGPPAPQGAGGNAGSRQTPVWPLAPERRDQQGPPHAPLGPALSGHPDPPRLADAQRGQAGRRQSRPVASSPLRKARLSSHHPLPWLIIDSTRPGRGETRYTASEFALGNRSCQTEAEADVAVARCMLPCMSYSPHWLG